MTFEEKCRERVSKLMNFTIHVNQSYLVIIQLRRIQEKQIDIINYSPAFYQSVIRSSFHTLFIDVAKMFDRNNKNECIYKLLKDMKANMHQLSNTPLTVLQYNQIGDNNPISVNYISVDSLVSGLLDEIERCDISALKKLRDKYYAHTDKESQNNLDRLFRENKVSLNTIGELLTVNANACTALYRYFFDAEISPVVINWDDFERTVRCLEEHKKLSNSLYQRSNQQKNTDKINK